MSEHPRVHAVAVMGLDPDTRHSAPPPHDALMATSPCSLKQPPHTPLPQLPPHESPVVDPPSDDEDASVVEELSDGDASVVEELPSDDDQDAPVVESPSDEAPSSVVVPSVFVVDAVDELAPSLPVVSSESRRQDPSSSSERPPPHGL